MSILKKTYSYFLPFIHGVIGRKKDSEKAIYIFSYPRSGSTWLMNILAGIPGACPLFEPFNPIELPSLKKYSLGHKIYPQKKSDVKNILKLTNKISQGKILNRWMTSHTSFKTIMKSKFFVFKILRVNYMLGDFINNITEPKYILLRHPGAVLSSHIRASKGINRFENIDLNQRSMICNQQDISILTKTVQEEYEKVIINWCIENKKLYSFQEKAKIIFYEDLKTDLLQEVKSIFAYSKLEVPSNVLEIANKPSLTSNKDSSLSSKDPLARWRDDFTQNQILRMQEILDYFKISFYSMDNIKPIKNSN